MEYDALIFRWMHVLCAVMLGGGVLFCRFCLLDGSSKEAFFDRNETARRRWMMLVGICSLFLLLSGCYNFYLKLVTYRLGGTYHGLFGIKLILGLVSFYLASVLAGRSERAKRFRQREIFWLNLLAGLLVVTILIGGYMKVSSTTAPLKADLSNQGTKNETVLKTANDVIVTPRIIIQKEIEEDINPFI